MSDETLPQKNRATLERLDERTASIQEDIAEIKKELSNKYVPRVEFEALKERVADRVTRKEFDPVMKIVYGAVGLILLAVLTAIVGSVIIAL